MREKGVILLNVVKETSQTLMPFNYDWILERRKKKFENIINILEASIREALGLLSEYDFKYVGHHILTPEERIDIINASNSKPTVRLIEDKKVRDNKHFEVHKNTLLVVRLEFEFQNHRIHSLIHVPFLKDHKISTGGVDYYPEIPIVEKCIHINFKSGLLTIKVARAPLKFWRDEEYKFTSVSKSKIYREILITTRIHQASSKSKKKRNSPIVLYYLVKGWRYTLNKLNINFDEITFVENYIEEDKDHEYFPINIKNEGVHERSIYLKVNKSSMEDINKRRFIACILRELSYFNRRFTINDLIDDEAIIWMLLLGQYVYVNKDLIIYPQVVVTHVKEHLSTNEKLIDGITRKAFKSLGINVFDFDDLLYHVFYKMDEWYVNFVPSDLYEKRITYTPMFSSFDRKLYSSIFKIMKKMKLKKRDMDLSDAGIFKYSNAYKPTWFNDSKGFFSANPSRCNGNMYDILLHRFILTDSDESGGNRKKGKQAPREIQLAHPSHLCTLSITTVPASTPIISGSINPYIDTDEEDNIVIDRDLKNYVDNCFKR